MDKVLESLRSAMLELLKLVIELQEHEITRLKSIVIRTSEERQALSDVCGQLDKARNIGIAITDMNLKGDDEDGEECTGSKE